LAEEVRVRATAKYSGAMIRRAALMLVALAAGAAGGALLGGCGGATKTVTVSGAAAPTSSATAQSTVRTSTSTSTVSTAGAPAGQASTGSGATTNTPSATAQGTSTTRTAPAPAFTKTETQSAEATANAQAEAAAVAVTAHGYTPTDITEYHPNQTLRVLIGTRTGSTYAQRAFFFLDNHYLGTDAGQPSASIHVLSQSDTEVTLAYALYRAHDSLCCPSGGQAVVHFQLNDGQLVPLGQIPPVSSATGLARQ
jgi:LppP/LprE lipoprotein